MNISLICPTRFLTLSPARWFPRKPIFRKKRTPRRPFFAQSMLSMSSE